MNSIRRTAFLLAALALTADPSALAGQPRNPQTVREALAKLRETGSSSPAAAFLSQAGRRHPAQALDELADSLVAIGTSYRVGDPPADQRAARAARLAPLSSANPASLAERAARMTEWGLPAPVAYPRAFEALVRVFEEAQDVGMRGGTLYLLTRLPETGRVVAFLSQVASADDVTAPTAIRHLAMDMGEAGVAALRRLYERDAVVQQTAREHLEAFANYHGWNR